MEHPQDPSGSGRTRPPGLEGHLSLSEIVADFTRRKTCLARRAARSGMTRREFLEFLAAGTALAAVASSVGPLRAAEGPSRSRVVVVTHPEVVLKGYRANPAVLRQMLDRALMELSGARTEGDAWRAFSRADDVVAIKHNSMGRPTLNTHTEINSVFSEQMTAFAGVSPARIFVVDRQIPEPYNEFSDPFTLPSRQLQTRLRRLYTDHATAIFNVSVLKAHFDDGISTALKNHLGSVNNPAVYHGWEPEGLPRSLPELNALGPIRTKTRLCVIDAIRPLYAGGPGDNSDYRWDYGGLIVGTDPVAVTAVGMRLLETKRAEVHGKEWPMTAAREMVAYAQQIGLGNADAGRIDLVEAKMG
jgi:hypothetical protein